MHINWKVRFRNKVWLTSMLATVIAFIFDLLALTDCVPAISEGMVMDCITTLLTLLTGLGVIIDPTTQGASDSERALGYD